MILSDQGLVAKMKSKELRVTPLRDPETQIQPASIDLTLGCTFKEYIASKTPLLDPRDKSTMDSVGTTIIEPDGYFVIQPGAFILAHCQEVVHMPDNLSGRVEGRSSMGRLGVTVHATAGFVDPGFHGQITLELSNINRVPVKLYAGMRISQMVVQTMVSAAMRPYSSERGSKYQAQKGTVTARVDTRSYEVPIRPSNIPLAPDTHLGQQDSGIGHIPSPDTKVSGRRALNADTRSE